MLNYYQKTIISYKILYYFQSKNEIPIQFDWMNSKIRTNHCILYVLWDIEDDTATTLYQEVNLIVLYINIISRLISIASKEFSDLESGGSALLV